MHSFFNKKLLLKVNILIYMNEIQLVCIIYLFGLSHIEPPSCIITRGHAAKQGKFDNSLRRTRISR
jgi:hypothetical protein